MPTLNSKFTNDFKSGILSGDDRFRSNIEWVLFQFDFIEKKEFSGSKWELWKKQKRMTFIVKVI